MRFIIEVLLISFGAYLLIVGLFTNWSYSEITWKERLFILSAGLLMVYFSLGMISKDARENKERSAKEELIWQAKGCPVYKTECGGKHKYVCERKAAVIGRNQVGDIFVEAYGTCQK